MKVTTATFKAVSGIFLSSKSRRDKEYAEFLSFFRELIEETDGAIANAFGKINVEVARGKTKETCGLILTVADYIYWQEKFAAGFHFVEGIEAVKTKILMCLAEKAESNKLTADERKALLAILDPA